MRRKYFLSLLCFLLVLPTAPVHAAVAKEGGKCTKLKSVAHISGMTLVCSTAGRVLIWKKYVAVAKATQSQVTMPTSGSPADTSILPFVDFNQLTIRTRDISALALNSIVTAIKSAGKDSAVIELFTGPNSQDMSPKDFEAIRSVQKIFYGSNLPERVSVIYYSAKDSDWGKQQMLSLQPAPEYQNTSGGPKTSVSGAALVDMGYGTNADTNPYLLSGAIEAHEFMHTIQQHQFIGQPNRYWTLPRWMVEGGGRFVENLVFSGFRISDYLKTAKNSELAGFDERYFSDFLNATTSPTFGDAWSNSSKYSDAVVYGVGAKVHEILIALKGPNTLINFMDDVARTGNFTASFEKLYGISWADAAPLISKYVFDSSR